MPGISVAGEDGCVFITPETNERRKQTGLKKWEEYCVHGSFCVCYLYLGMILLLENSSKILLIDFLSGRQAILELIL